MYTILKSETIKGHGLYKTNTVSRVVDTKEHAEKCYNTFCTTAENLVVAVNNKEGVSVSVELYLYEGCENPNNLIDSTVYNSKDIERAKIKENNPHNKYYFFNSEGKPIVADDEYPLASVDMLTVGYVYLPSDVAVSSFSKDYSFFLHNNAIIGDTKDTLDCGLYSLHAFTPNSIIFTPTDIAVTTSALETISDYLHLNIEKD